MIKIGYRIGGSFEDYCKDGNIGFEILFPHIYSSYEEAEKNNYRISAMMKKQDDGEVVIILYEDKIPVETIHWDEWMKYKCNHLKREKIDAYLDLKLNVLNSIEQPAVDTLVAVIIQCLTDTLHIFL